MKKLLIFIVLTSLSVPSMAQAQESKSEFGIRGGVNLATLMSANEYDRNMKIGFHVGVFDKISLSENFAIQPELLYSLKGVKFNYDDEPLVDGYSKFNLHYIDLPVKFVFDITDNFEIQVGPYLSYLVFADVKTEGDVLNFFEINETDELDRKNFNTFDIGASAGLGFNLSPLVIGINYNMGFIPVAKEDEDAYDMLEKGRNSVIEVYAGIKF